MEQSLETKNTDFHIYNSILFYSPSILIIILTIYWLIVVIEGDEFAIIVGGTIFGVIALLLLLLQKVMSFFVNWNMTTIYKTKITKLQILAIALILYIIGLLRTM